MQKSFLFVKKNLKNKYLKDKKYCKVRDHCHYTGEYRGAAHSICNLKCSVPKRIYIVFHNGSNYDYDFIIKEFKKQCTCLGENTEKYITFTVSINKVTRINKNREEVTKNISYISHFIDSALFKVRSLSSLLLIIFLKEFIELYLNADRIKKKKKCET